MHPRHPTVVLLLALLAFGKTAAAQDDPPDELKSPDLQYSVRILRRADSRSILLDECAIAVCRKGHYLAKFPTFGYLLEAFWSPDGKYVAVNNRRANSGDYLWVFRLHDGSAMAKPVDFNGSYDQYTDEVSERVAAVCPEVASHGVYRLFREAQGWTRPNILQVKSDVRFWHIEAHRFAITETYVAKAGGLVLLDRKIKPVPSPKES